MSRSILRRGTRAVVAVLALAMVGLVSPNASAAGGCGNISNPCYGRPSENGLVLPNAYTQYKFWKWDYSGGSQDSVDNPIGIIFVSNSPNVVGRVYSQLTSNLSMIANGSNMVMDGEGPSYPGDTRSPTWTSIASGRKTQQGCAGVTPACQPNQDVHVRAYGNDGPTGTQVYQTISGYKYYAVASVHYDFNDDSHTKTGDPYYGYQDNARDWLLNQMTVKRTVWSQNGTVLLNNACQGYDYIGGALHECRHDGYAVRVYIGG